MKWIAIMVLALSSTGCFAIWGQKIKEDSWRDSAQSAAQFDMDCASMRVVKENKQGRYLLAGCGQRVVYLCYNDETATGTGYSMGIDNKTIGAKCQRVK